MYKHVIVSGSYQKLHIGHKDLIRTAMENGDIIHIGIMSDEYIAKTKKYFVPYQFRYNRVLDYVMSAHRDKFNSGAVIIDTLHDSFGDAIKNTDYDAIVVSDETKNSADILNAKRVEAGLNPLVVIVVPLALDEDGHKISSSRIMAKEIDSNGRYLDRMRIKILGTSGGMSSPDRASAGIIVEYKHNTYLFDCGDMTSVQMMKAKTSVTDLDGIFISHGHIDHYIGLPMLIMHHMMLQHREKPLKIFAPQMVIDNIKPIFDNYPIPTPFTVIFCDIKDVVFTYNGITITPFPVVHSIPDCYGFKIEDEHNHKIVYSGDTQPCEELIRQAYHADVLIHEATFAKDFEQELYGHTNIHGAIQVGQAAQVSKLVLLHVSLRYHRDMTSYNEEAVSDYIPVIVGYDLQEIDL